MSFAHVVLVGSGVAHLDQAYTYRVPENAGVHVGSLVRVPVRGRSREGVVVELLEQADVPRVQPVRAVLGPGLPQDVVAVAHDVARHYLSSFGEALSASIPPRVAEEEASPHPWPQPDAREADLSWIGNYKNAQGLLEAVRGGRPGAFAWRPLAQEARGKAIAALAAETLRTGRSALVLVPEVRAAGSVTQALEQQFGAALARLGSDRSQRERYRAWLALERGDARVAVGGRAAVFAPMHNLGLIVVDDEGHISYKERRAPRFHARPVAFGRARSAGAVFVAVGSPSSVEVAEATARGVLQEVVPSRALEVRTRPAVVVVDKSRTDERLTPSARTIAIVADTLASGSRAVVLVHRSGEEARKIATRTVRVVAPKNPARLDARGLASDPIAFARALRESDLLITTPVLAKDIELDDIGCIAIVDADAALATPEFRAAEEAFSTWWRAARWLGRDGKIVMETNNPRAPAIAALVRWDPSALLRHEAQRRNELGYPPYASLVRVDTTPEHASAIAKELAGVGDVLGPTGEDKRSIIIVRSRDRHGLLKAMSPLAATWRAAGTDVRVDVDPRDVLR